MNIQTFYDQISETTYNLKEAGVDTTNLENQVRAVINLAFSESRDIDVLEWDMVDSTVATLRCKLN